VIVEYDRRRAIARQGLLDSCVTPLRGFVLKNRDRLVTELRLRSDTGERVEVIRLPLLSPSGGQLYVDPDPDQVPLLETGVRASGPLMPMSRFDLTQLLDNPEAFRRAIEHLDEQLQHIGREGD
jgi:hypothetical protein